eukprot:GHVT01086963.1.p1 GENE.GHVT01086963.1~~GHVT01086963.1.p1  ORF type:complete len:305 (+),score=9.14 GHVT01086963.1:91-915(+)
MTEVPPLFVIEFLHRVMDTFEDYFSECTESIIKDNYVIVYELLDEMLDNGFPLATESNILKELIKPPNILRAITDTVTGKSTSVSATLPTGQLSNVPWRRTGVKYTNNEAYFDVIEEIDAIIDKSGSTVFAEIQGYVDCLIKLTGRLDLTVGPKQTMGKVVENVIVEVPFSKSVLNVTLTPTQGKYSFDPVNKVMTWDVGKIDPTKLPNIRGSINMQTGAPPPDSNPVISVQFTISQMAVSGIKVNRLDMYGEKYKPFKGVKYVTKAGKFQVRT